MKATATASPGSAVDTKRVVLKPRKVRPFFARHPWVLDSAIARVEGSPDDGDVVDLFSDRDQFIARGIYNAKSRIRVRLYSWQADEALDEALWRRRMATAAGLRRALGYDRPEGAVRLVSSEADGLGGMVIERYAGHLVMQITALAMYARLDALVQLAADVWQPASVTVRADGEMAKTEGFTLPAEVRRGTRDDGLVFIEEHGIRYGVDLATGQKTGFYLDQRENRRAAASYCAGRRVLDACCYSGGFSLAALQLGGAREAHGIDSSPKAIALAEANAQLNGLSGARFETADVFQRMEQLAADGERYGVVVLDPPKFARSAAHVPQALRAYHHLNRLAVSLLEPGGILVTCSCSGHIARDQFAFMLADVAQRTERDIQILESCGAAPDHPVTATCLETEYLKCLICRVV
ncbi:MAG TPA: class I SAM-dependent rRNA methyltransferase [Pirellulales bacterium]|nr:class I SAM-dependent rRNA methyltransferase [Pirellulales bacterium]